MGEYQSSWDSKMETLSEKKFRLFQEKAFLDELNYVWKNSPFYQQKFSEAGLEPND
ncbi:MAG: phenylacetate--CoA ligase, partial [Aestuariibacter sp.]|nr:phenylacetate--CoA ligase [Aestuariibacter sp.]